MLIYEAEARFPEDKDAETVTPAKEMNVSGKASSEVDPRDGFFYPSYNIVIAVHLTGVFIIWRWLRRAAAL